MLNIINESIDDLVTGIEKKYLYFYGAGRVAENMLEMPGFNGRITALIDGNSQYWDTCFVFKGEEIPIISIQEFIKQLKEHGKDNCILLITPTYHAWDIIQTLDREKELNQLKCYVSILLRNYPYEKKLIPFTAGKPKIPKIIHYCWFGGSEMPEHLLRCIDSWKKYCPDYIIQKWDESNYDISKNRYMQEAYDNGAWGFVPDYARLDIIYQYGGIYLDTDVELISSLEKLRSDSAFFGACCNAEIGLGLGFGAVEKHELIKKLRDYYDDKSFYRQDGTKNLDPCYVYNHPVFKDYGFEIENKYQNIKGAAIYPSEVLSPTGLVGMADNFTEDTIAVHHGELSWVGKKEKEAFEITKRRLMDRVIGKTAIIHCD